MSTLTACGHCDHLLPSHAEDCPFAPDEVSGVKYDGDKPRMGLIPPRIEVEVADVLTYGAKKYPAADNWKNVDNLQRRYIDAALRHINAVRQGEARDSETGKLHVAHAVCCLMFIGEDYLSQSDILNGPPGKT